MYLAVIHGHAHKRSLRPTFRTTRVGSRRSHTLAVFKHFADRQAHDPGLYRPRNAIELQNFLFFSAGRTQMRTLNTFPGEPT